LTNQAYDIGLARVGEDVTIWPEAKIVFPDVVTIGDSVIIDDFAFLMGGKRTEIGSFVHIGSFTSITGGGELIMEDFSGCGSGCRIATGTEDFLGGSLTNPAVPHPYREAQRSFVHFERHAVLGADVAIMPGVTLGEGVSVGAKSLLLEDCEPWTVYVGSPARPLRPRPKDKILELEEKLRDELYDARGFYIPKRKRT
jgi:galactoside O-acetyltransferase